MIDWNFYSDSLENAIEIVCRSFPEMVDQRGMVAADTVLLQSPVLAAILAALLEEGHGRRSKETRAVWKPSRTDTESLGYPW
jgi:hypothetical protein